MEKTSEARLKDLRSLVRRGDMKGLEAQLREMHGRDGDEFFVAHEGLCFATVCSSLGSEETAKRMKAIPCGTRRGWELSEESFSDDSPNPCQCPKHPTHMHYLFAC